MLYYHIVTDVVYSILCDVILNCNIIRHIAVNLVFLKRNKVKLQKDTKLHSIIHDMLI